MAKALKKNKSANPKPGRAGTMLATPLTESEIAKLREKRVKGLKLMAEYRKTHPIKPL